MATDKIRRDIANILSALNANFMDGQEHPMLGHVKSPKSTTTGMPTEDGNLLKELFEKQFDKTTETDRKFQSNNTSADNLVYIKQADKTTYDNSNSNQWTSITSNVGGSAASRIVDINVYHLADDTSTKPRLKQLYAIHSLMHPDMWAQFADRVKKNISTESPWTLSVKGPEIASGSNQDITLENALGSDTNLKDVLSRLAKQPLFHPFALRRLVFLFIRMVSFYIAMDAYFKHSKVNAEQLAQGIYNLLDNEFTEMTTTSLSNVTQGVNKRIRRYNNFTDGINEINDTYEQTRTFTKKNALRMEDEARFEKRAGALFYVALTVFLITIVVNAGAVFIDMDFKQRLMIVGAAMAFAAVASLAMVVLFTRQVVEGFSSSSAFAFKEGTDILDITKAVHYNNAILELARDYLQAVSILVHSLRSYRAFGNTTYAMTKEYRYFNDADQQLRNIGEKYKATHRASDLYQKKYGATVYLFIVVALITCAVATGYIVAGEKMPMAQPFVLGVGGFFAFIVFFIYILEITGYVRTDGDKKYWGVPDKRTLE